LTPYGVAALVALNLAVFTAELHTPDPGTFIASFAAVPYDITHGIALAPPSPPLAVLTILTAMFVHGGAAHIAINLLFLACFGPAVEARCGHVRFVAFYLLCGIVGELAQIVVDPGSHLPAIGASGAIAGVLGAYLISYPLRWWALLVIGAWAAAQFAAGLGELAAQSAGANPGVATFVHIGGFCCGVFAIGRFRRRDAGMRASSW
jgi:membrane associated rhomboid family serine protease